MTAETEQRSELKFHDVSAINRNHSMNTETEQASTVRREIEAKVRREVAESLSTPRCPDCEHSLRDWHREEGCWFACSNAAKDRDVVCPCVSPGLASPEPSEPPPGPHRDAAGKVFVGKPGAWKIAGWSGEDAWDVARDFVKAPLVPLFSVDELIPDPNPGPNIDAIQQEATDAGYLRHGATSKPDAIRATLRVLRTRARAEARQTEGGSDGRA